MPAKWQQWMPLHIDKWRGSPAVRAMHPAARMGYLELILSQWQSDDCSLPSDALDLAELSGLGDELWATYSARILRNFETLTDGRLRNPVCFEEWQEAKRIYDAGQAGRDALHEKRQQAGKRGALRRWGDSKPKAKVPDATDDDSKPKAKNALTGTGTGTETEKPEVLDPHAMARGLCERLNLSRQMGQGSVYMAACDIAQHEAKRGGNLEALCDRMESAYMRWIQEAPNLEYQWSVAKFFGDGWWSKPEAWPRKRGIASIASVGSNMRFDSPEQKAAKDREAYAMWQSMSKSFRQANPWEGPVPA